MVVKTVTLPIFWQRLVYQFHSDKLYNESCMYAIGYKQEGVA